MPRIGTGSNRVKIGSGMKPKQIFSFEIRNHDRKRDGEYRSVRNPDAEKKAVEWTARTGLEAGFLYDTRTGKLITPIRFGDKDKGPDLELSYKDREKFHTLDYGYLHVGRFHVHPKVERDCGFSAHDIASIFHTSFKEEVMGCANEPNKRMIFRPDDIDIEDLIKFHNIAEKNAKRQLFGHPSDEEFRKMRKELVAEEYIT